MKPRQPNLPVRLALVWVLLFPIPAAAIGLRGGAGGGGATRPAIGGGGGISANRPSTPNLGVSRPAPNISRPSPSPNISRPSVSRPSPNISMPSGTRPGMNFPSGSFPQVNRPSGGFKPSSPTTLPTARPSTGPAIFDIPNKGSGSAVTRPSTRPSLPDLGNGNLVTRPGIDPSLRPGVSGSRPNIDLPSRPGGATTLPGFDRPGDSGRPMPGDLGGFLGMDKPLRPSTRPTLPGFENRPVVTKPTLPGVIDRPTTLPGRLPGIGNDRPIFNRPGQSWDVGNINLGNNLSINSRPSWVNINQNAVININNRWQGRLDGLHGWETRFPSRIDFRHSWGHGIRYGWWHGCYRHGHWFDDHWWNGHHHHWCGWHYGYWFNRYPWTYWWTRPVYVDLRNWFLWNAPAAAWTQPIYYDYGPGGNVTYENNYYYVDGAQIAGRDEFVQSAMTLATVEPPAAEEQATAAEWMPLGTFALSTAEKDTEPTRMVQLAVNRQGVISGTIFNIGTDQAQSVQGQVDKETQRAAFRIGENEDIVIETGLYNLTQDEVPVLVHFGADRDENWLLVRLDAPPTEDAEQ